MAALAGYFGVSPGDFSTIPWSGDCVRVQGEDAEILDCLDDAAIKVLLAAVNGLSAASLQLLVDIATKLRISDHHPPVPADAPSYARLTEAEPLPRRTTALT
ncbi:hypothetical protein [Rhodococcus sp. UFZ-B548]|uniref:hypothetical protein n=1 Tax=Rhodococcus sp. UFZ-B548 TaxID=2742212 RepID=UPI0015F46B76|nr:hypothetical protein [Rhodococcus sp. UFZ-B548]